MELDLNNPRESFLKYCAFPKPFFFYDNTRVIVSEAIWSPENTFEILRVIPAGKKEMAWDVFIKTRQQKTTML